MNDGATAAEHSASAVRQFAALGRKVAIAVIDDAIECPEALGYLWGFFGELSMGLSSNGFGPPVVTWEALKAWTGFTAVRLEPWEAKVLVTLGYKRAVIEAEGQAKSRGDQNKNRSGRAGH